MSELAQTFDFVIPKTFAHHIHDELTFYNRSIPEVFCFSQKEEDGQRDKNREI